MKTIGERETLCILCECFVVSAKTYLRSVGGDRSTSPVDQDYVIPRLKELLARPSLALSKLIWQTMSSLVQHPNYLQATYRRNRSWGAHFADSQLVQPEDAFVIAINPRRLGFEYADTQPPRILQAALANALASPEQKQSRT